MTAGSVLGIAHFTFHEGKVEEFKQRSGECMDIVRERDKGTLRYEVYFNDDESKAVVIEEYVDEAALIDHGKNIGEELSAAVMATAEVHGEILGELSDEFRQQLQDGPVTPFRPSPNLRLDDGTK